MVFEVDFIAKVIIITITSQIEKWVKQTDDV